MLYFRKLYASAAFFALLLGAFSACMEVDVVSPIGRTGAVGDQGLSDLELWQQGVRSGEIPGDPKHLTVTDFFLYLQSLDTETGPAGTPGQPGRSAYEVWKEAAEAGSLDDPHHPGQKWPTTDNDIPSYWRYLSGSRGANGATPKIGKDGYWYIGGESTGIKATGEEGEPGDVAVPPTITVQDGVLYIDGTPTQVSVKPTPGKNGKDGKSHTLDIDPTTGNWLIDNEDSGVSAKGPDGYSPAVSINPTTGEWEIDKVGTGKTAFGKKGPKGDPGDPGKSAYEIWKEKVIAGEMPDPYDPANGMWPKEMYSTTSFWEYISGGTKYTVVPVAPQDAYPNEQIDRRDGSTTFIVLDYRGNNVSEQATVSNISVIHPEKEYTGEAADNDISVPHIRIPRADLSDAYKANQRLIRPNIKVVGKNKTFSSQKFVTVPNLIKIRATISGPRYSGDYKKFPHFRQTGFESSFAQEFKGALDVSFYIECCIDGVWQPLPNTTPFRAAYLIKGKQQPTLSVIDDENQARCIIDPYHTKRPGDSSLSVLAMRTMRLSDDMIKAHEAGSEMQKDILNRYYWRLRGDDEWSYLTFVFGDGDKNRDTPQHPWGRFIPPIQLYAKDGFSLVDFRVPNTSGYGTDVVDYGDRYVIPDLIYYPPAEEGPKFDTSQIYIDLRKEDEKILWGEFDKTKGKGFYRYERVPHVWSSEGDGKYENIHFVPEQEDGLTIWKPKEAKQDQSNGEMGQGYVTAFEYPIVLNEEGMGKSWKGASFGNIYVYDPKDYTTQYRTNYYIKKIRENMLISTSYINISKETNQIQSLRHEFYGKVLYQVIHDANNDKWYLVDFWNTNQKWEIQKKNWPGLDYCWGILDADGNRRPNP